MTPERWKQIETIFTSAVELEGDDRISYLDEACGDDMNLRQEVESLLNDAGDDEAAFSTIVMDAAEALVVGERTGLVGKRIGPYRVTGAVGHGGMAEVYKAVRDDEQFEQVVAIKVVRRGMVNDAMLVRFRYERQILASLNHPNIAKLLDGGTTDDGMPFFVMEYIDGLPITEYAEANGLSVNERIRLFRQVTSAVQHAHRNLIVHRDLKPSNILVTADGTPKLLDFGIAKLLSPPISPVAVTLAQTMTEVRLMTPMYASPEQVRGEPVTTSTDVYALGAVLYELLTGEVAHRFRDTSMAEIERVVCEAEIERPSAALARAGGQSARRGRILEGDIDNIVLTALRKEPERRYESVGHFAEDIRRYLEGRPVTARQDTFGYRAGKFVRRHRLAVAAASLVGLLLVAFSVMMAMQAVRIARERDRANEVTKFLVELFEQSNPSEARGSTVTAREILDKGAARIESELGDQPELQATMMDTMGRVYRSLGLYASARPLLERAVELRRTTLGGKHPDVGASLHELAVLSQAEGDRETSERLYREALEIRRSALGERHADVAETYSDLGELMRNVDRLDESEDLARKALDIRRDAFGDRSAPVAYSLNNLAAVLDDRDQDEEAMRLFLEALEIKREVLGPDHPSVANTLNNIAVLYRNMGQDKAALPFDREAVAIRRKVLGAEHPDLAVSLNNLAIALKEQGELDEAEPLFREALAMKLKLLGPTHQSTANGYYSLADLLAAKGDWAAAEPIYRECLAATIASLSATHWRTALVRSAYGHCLAKLGRPAEALPLLEAGVAGLETEFGDDHERTKKAAGFLAEVKSVHR